MTQTEEKLANMYNLLSIQTIVIGMMIQAPLLTELIWTGMMLHKRIHNHCERLKIKVEEEDPQQMNQINTMAY